MKTTLKLSALTAAGICGLSLGQANAASTILDETFDNLNAWTLMTSTNGEITANGGAAVMTIAVNTGQQGVDTQMMQTSIDATNLSNIVLELDMFQTLAENSFWEDNDLFEIQYDSGSGLQTLLSDPVQWNANSTAEPDNTEGNTTGAVATLALPSDAEGVSNLIIKFSGTMSSNNEQYHLTSLKITADDSTIPEPSSTGLLGLGGLLLLLRRRR